jgi:hypothetical protein
MGLFDRLGYNFPEGDEDRIPELSDDVQKQLSNFKLLNDWQAEDISANTASGYFQNPVSEVTNQIISLCGSLAEYANTANLFSLEDAAISTSATASEFLEHTDRISGISEIDEDNPDKPYYDTAMGVGRTIMYAISQTDEITNTAPILGSFTSVMVEDELDTYYNSLVAVGNSTAAIPILDDISSFMDTRRLHDENFFKKSKVILGEITKARTLTNMGQSQDFLMRNFIGTSKLIERLDK